MPIKRCSDQKAITLEEFYIDLTKTSPSPYIEIGTAMLELINLINEIFQNTLLWGLTSHDRLVLQNINDSRSEWFVIISNVGTKEYYFEYLLPHDKRPWDNAYINGKANSLKEAKKYLLIAMTESRGWTDNEELKQIHARTI